MKRLLAAVLILCGAAVIAFAAFTYLGPTALAPTIDTTNGTATSTQSVSSFEDCVAAGYPVSSAGRKQCTTPDGRTFAEETQEQPTYTNATNDMIRVTAPTPGSVTGKTFSVKGEARGTWYFEASFPVQVLDKNGVVIASLPAQAQGDWMTEEFVPFAATITVPTSYIGPATLVLRRDNPSGLPEHDASVSIPFTIEY